MNNITTTTPVSAIVAPTGVLSPEQGLELMNNLINRQDIPAGDLAQTFQNLVAVYTKAFTPAPEPVAEKKRRRRRNVTLSPNLGWPKGVSREEYAAFKANPPADFTEGMNPQAFKRYLDAKNGIVNEATTTVQTEAAPEVKEEAKATVTSGKKDQPKGKPASPAALAKAGISTGDQGGITSGRKATSKKK